MKVTQEVILDLLPVYLSGEASPATRALVEEYLKQDEEFARRVRVQCAENFAAALPSSLPPDLELRVLRRTRALLGFQRWLFGFAFAFRALAFRSEFTLKNGQLQEFHFLLRDYPAQFGTCFALGLVCWIAYFLIRRRLRTTTL
jgi:anti-sigma factor RsiW